MWFNFACFADRCQIKKPSTASLYPPPCLQNTPRRQCRTSSVQLQAVLINRCQLHRYCKHKHFITAALHEEEKTFQGLNQSVLITAGARASSSYSINFVWHLQVITRYENDFLKLICQSAPAPCRARHTHATVPSIQSQIAPGFLFFFKPFDALSVQQDCQQAKRRSTPPGRCLLSSKVDLI